MRHILICVVALGGACRSSTSTSPNRPTNEAVSASGAGAPETVTSEASGTAEAAIGEEESPTPVEAPEGGPSSDAEAAAPDAAGATVTSTAAPEHVQGSIRITAEEAREHGLPAIAFTIDERDMGFSSTRFPEPEVYLMMSGPPGGPLLVRILAWREGATDEAVIVRVLRERYSGPGYEPLAFGLPARTDLAGSSRTMLPFTSGESMARTNWCAIVVKPAAGAPEGLLVTVGIGDRGAPDCRVPLGDEWIAKVLATLRLD